MIKTFRNRGLERFHREGDGRRLPPELLSRLERRMDRLDIVKNPTEMGLPGFALHPLKGSMAGWWAVRVSGNWRLIFRFAEDGNVVDVDLVDYH